MNLAIELKAVTEAVRKQAPKEVFSAMETATAKLAASGLGVPTWNHAVVHIYMGRPRT